MPPPGEPRFTATPLTGCLSRRYWRLIVGRLLEIRVGEGATRDGRHFADLLVQFQRSAAEHLVLCLGKTRRCGVTECRRYTKSTNRLDPRGERVS